jgi:hypothetical protein
MVKIAKANDVVTLINVFTVAPEDQQRLVDVLVEATQAVMRKQPGFVSADIHKSLDGTRVANYAQWPVERCLRLCFGIEKLPSTWGRRLG